MEDFTAFESTLRQMGINPRNIGKQGSQALPPIPGSDPLSLQQNRYDGFYKLGAREFWEHAEMSTNTVVEKEKCKHYFMKNNNIVTCKYCHIGWTVPLSFQVTDGKLYDGDTALQFTL